MTGHQPVQRYFLNLQHTRNAMLPVVNERFAERKGDWVLYAEHVYALRACKRRVLDAAEQAIRDALSGDGRNLYAELTALAAIDALRKDSDD